MDAITRELRRRGVNRCAGTRYAVVFGDLDRPFLLDLTALGEALAGFQPDGGDHAPAA